VKSIFLTLLLIISARSIKSQNSIAIDSLYNSEEEKYSIGKVSDPKLQRYCKSLFSANSDSVYAELQRIPAESQSERKFMVDCCGCLIDIYSREFDSTKHKIIYDKRSKNYLIDGKSFWGGDGTLPHNEISKFMVVLNGIKVKMPLVAYDDLYEPNLKCYQDFDEGGNSMIRCYTRVYKSEDQKYLFIFMQNSDAAGSYEVVFVFEDGKYLRRVIDRDF